MNNVIANYTRGAILTRLNDVLPSINEAFVKHFKATYSMLTPPTVGIDGNGKRYIRVSTFKFFEARGKSYPESVYFFVDTTNGNVLKPAGYKTPETKNPRGNIFDKDILSKMTPYGVVYMGTKYAMKDTLQGILGVEGV